jgi:hypothetical protein
MSNKSTRRSKPAPLVTDTRDNIYIYAWRRIVIVRIGLEILSDLHGLGSPEYEIR